MTTLGFRGGNYLNVKPLLPSQNLLPKETFIIMDISPSFESLLEGVGGALYVRIALCEITAWRTAEPVPFTQRKGGERIDVRIGEPWAKQLFDCAWMCFSARLPEGAQAEDLVARIDVNGELCVVDSQGSPVRGLTNIKSTFDPKLGGPGKTVYVLPPEAVCDGLLELWADAGLNDLFGFVKDEGRVALAEVCVVREDVRQLYYDLETLRDWLISLSEEDGQAARLREDLTALTGDLNCESPASVTRARGRLAPWFSSPRLGPALIVHAIGHAHLDLAWLWPIRETVRKGARTFASALYNIERYPEYVFGMSQPQLYAWMKEHYPELYGRVKAAVKTGRIEPQGTFWVEPDCSMPSGEAFVRQVLHGGRFFKEEFGIVPNYCWQPDVFGYHGQLPQVLKKSGHDYFMTQKLSWNVVNRFGHHSFQWEGIDGTRILTHMLPEETYNGPGAARSLLKIANEYAEREISGHALMAFGIGDGGGGPDAEHLERLRRAPKLPGMPGVKIGKVSDFFEVWSRDAGRFPVWRGELYLERHQGTLTTQALVKRNNRKAEIALRELEWAAYLATTVADISYPSEALDRLWKEVLLYQFHDILPGSSIKRVYDECNARYAVILAELEMLTAERYAMVADGPVVFNSLSWDRGEWLNHEGVWTRVVVPALELARVGNLAMHATYSVSAAADRLENENLRIVFAEDGRIVSVWDKHRERETLAAGEPGNDLVVIEDTGDAWDFETDHPNKDVWPYLRRVVERPLLRECIACVDGPCAEVRQTWSYRSSEIRQTIRLFADGKQIEFDTQVDWREPARMLRVRFPVDVESETARFEIPFGHIHRSTREDTTHARAQIEVAALQWADLSDADGDGVALYNDCKHGHRVKGHTLDLALLRSVPHPGAALIDKNDRPDANGALYTDLGRHDFRYALRPHGAEVDAGRLTAEARAFNNPMKVQSGLGSTAVVFKAPRLCVDASELELTAIKPAEDGRGWVWRWVNVTGRSVQAHFSGLDYTCYPCDLVETDATCVACEKDGTTKLDFGPFEIKTLRFVPNDR